MRIRFPEAALTTALSLAAGCAPDAEPTVGAGSDTPPIAGDAAAQTPSAEVDDAALIAAGERNGAWLTYGRDYAETRFSPLDQIDAGTVGRLGLVWQYDTGTVRGLEATPLIHNGVLYATTSWSNVFALDAVTGREIWRWDAGADRIRGARACCDVVNRGVAIYEGRIYVGVVDGRLVALDAATGTPVWEVQTTPVDLPYTITVFSTLPCWWAGAARRACSVLTLPTSTRPRAASIRSRSTAIAISSPFAASRDRR